MFNAKNRFFELFRVSNYSKNTFVFLPVFFGHRFFDTNAQINCTISFISFCLCASSVYIFNDIMDVDYDKRHPEKSKRPIASGSITIRTGILISLILFVSGCSLSFFYHGYLSVIVISYGLLNILYSKALKKIAIIDISCIAVGFVLRVLYGGIASDVSVSKWLILMTFLISMFLAIAKRRDDVLIFLESGNSLRDSLDGYDLAFIDAVMGMMATVCLVCYIMYSVSEDVIRKIGSDNLYLTTFWVILGFLRYMQITYVSKKSGSPTKVFLNDRFLQVVIFCWLINFSIIIYL